MKIRTGLLALFLIIIPFSLLIAQETFEECTAGVASGKATADGRPLLWKTRDTGNIDNEVIWNKSGKYHFVSVINAGDPRSSWMGVNEKGFAIINTVSSDLERAQTGPGHGDLMAVVLGMCATVDEFQEYLDKTNVSGRRTATNYGVIDATGAAAFFETAGKEYWKFDANETEKGYVLRTNWAVNGKREEGKVPYSMNRYIRTDNLMTGFYESDKIDFKEIIRGQVRDFSDAASDPVEIPFENSFGGHTYGYFPNNVSICRNSTTSFSVIQGILPGGNPLLSTMWTILGQPATGITVPYWPVGETPPEADGEKTAPLCDAANKIRSAVYATFAMQGRTEASKKPLYIDTISLDDGNGGGIWKTLLPAEDLIFADAEKALAGWRKSMPSKSEMLKLEAELASRALTATIKAYKSLVIDP